jgi:isopentenyl-diphosphate Delta-isomerase
MEDHVVLVNEHDVEIGTCEKLEAHKKGLLHRAFSILLFNSKGELLLQKRAQHKYHSAGLWTNTCCSHPRPGELVKTAAQRRLHEEMGIITSLKFAYSFLYTVPLENDLTEHELDHVFIGTYDGIPQANSAEVEDWKFVTLDFAREDISKHPTHYTYWFKLILNHSQLTEFLLPQHY